MYSLGTHLWWEVVKWLVEKGANVNAVDKIGQTVLHAATHSDEWEVVKWLVGKGVNVDAVDKNGRTVLHETAASLGQLEEVKWLVEHGAHVDAVDNDGWTVLHAAAATPDQLEAVKWLVEQGANVDAIDNNGRTVLHAAAESHGRLEVVKWLVEHFSLIQSSITFENGNIFLTLPTSKTDYFRKGVRIPIAAAPPGSPTCPVAAIQILFDRFPASASAPLFARTFSPFSRDHFVKTICKALLNAGLNPTGFSGHSL